MKKRILFSVTTLLIIAIIIFNACRDDNNSDNTPTNYITLGVIMPLDQEKGELIKNALITAIDEINANSGVGNEYQIKLNIKSSEGPDRKIAAVNAAKDIVANSQFVTGIITSFSSSSTGVIEEIIIPKSYPTIAGSATAENLSGISDYFQRLCAPDPFEANVMADQANDYGIASVAIAVEDGDTYSSGMATAFQTAFGGGAATLVNFTANDPEYANKLTQLLAGNPEAIFISMINPNIFIEFFTELENMKDGKDLTNTSFILCDGLCSSDLFQAPVDYILGDVNGHPKNFGAFPSADTTSVAYTYFANELYQKYNQKVASYNAQFYDIGYLFAMAIEKAFKSASTSDMKTFRDKVNYYIRQVSHGAPGDPVVSPDQGWISIKTACNLGGVNYNGASGNCDIDSEGNAITPYSVFKVTKPGGHFAFEIIKIIP